MMVVYPWNKKESIMNIDSLSKVIIKVDPKSSPRVRILTDRYEFTPLSFDNFQESLNHCQRHNYKVIQYIFLGDNDG